MGLGGDGKKVNVAPKDRFVVDQVLIRHEFSAELAKYVDRLTNADKELIFMRFFLGYSPEEMAKRYERTPEEIEDSIFLVKQKIAKLIKGR